MVKIGKLALKHRHQTSLLKHSFKFANNVIWRISLKRCHLISICSWISWPWVNHLDLKWPSLPRGVYNACLLLFFNATTRILRNSQNKKKSRPFLFFLVTSKPSNTSDLIGNCLTFRFWGAAKDLLVMKIAAWLRLLNSKSCWRMIFIHHPRLSREGG